MAAVDPISNSSGGVQAYLNDRPLLDNWEDRQPLIRTAIDSPGVIHTLRIEYFATIAVSSSLSDGVR